MGEQVYSSFALLQVNVCSFVCVTFCMCIYDYICLILCLCVCRKGIIASGCSRKIVFFHNSLQPLLAYIGVRDLQSSQRDASVQSLLLAGNFLYNQ